MLKTLVDDIGRRAPHARVVVYDDGSEPEAAAAGAHVVRLPHGGKYGFWRLMNRVLADARQTGWDRFLVLPDDVELGPRFFDRLEKLWLTIPCADKMLLNPVMDERGPCRQWTSIEPVAVGDNLWRVGWNDCAFYTDKRFTGAFKGFRRPAASRWRRPGISSGVGEQLSKWAWHYGYSLWQSADSLAWHGAHPSRMHPDRSCVL